MDTSEQRIPEQNPKNQLLRSYLPISASFVVTVGDFCTLLVIEVKQLLRSWVMSHTLHSIFKNAPVILQAEQMNFFFEFIHICQSQVYGILHLKRKKTEARTILSQEELRTKSRKIVSFLVTKSNQSLYMRAFVCLPMCAKIEQTFLRSFDEMTWGYFKPKPTYR